MRNTVFGILTDALGHASNEVLERGAAGPELRYRAWSTPSAEVRSVQAPRIPVDRDHDHHWVGEVVYLERAQGGNLWAVAHVDERVSPAVRVRVGGSDVIVETDLYWSASRLSTPDYRDVIVDSVALTAAPCQIAARPVTFLRGALDHREAPRRWQLDGYQRELLERATAAHLERRRHGGPLVVHDPSELKTKPVRVRGGWIVDDQLWADRQPDLPDVDRPPGKLRIRPARIIGVS